MAQRHIPAAAVAGPVMALSSDSGWFFPQKILAGTIVLVVTWIGE